MHAIVRQGRGQLYGQCRLAAGRRRVTAGCKHGCKLLVPLGVLWCRCRRPAETGQGLLVVIRFQRKIAQGTPGVVVVSITLNREIQVLPGGGVLSPLHLDPAQHAASVAEVGFEPQCRLRLL